MKLFPLSIETLDSAPARLVDEICDRFESACQAGQNPRIEDYLNGCPDEIRRVLLCELIQLDEYYRHDDYRKRFPELVLADSLNTFPEVGNATPSDRERYTFVAAHAQGGMGRVSVFYDREMHRRVAIKELHPESANSSRVLSRFLQEAQITGRLEHPSIVPVYDLVKPKAVGEAPFYTMRFVNGRTLTESIHDYHCKRHQGAVVAVDLLTLLNAFVSVCQAVAYAHTQGVVHRDLKGSNVILGNFGEVIVLDWGLAKLVDSREGLSEFPPGTPTFENPEHTLQGVIKGTPGYLSPEQATGQTDLIGPRTDVYGLGAILYEILTGQAPFTGATVCEVLAQVERAELIPPSVIVPGIPVDLEAACIRAMSKSPEDRHTSASELAAEIQRWLAESADRNRTRLERERFFNLSLDLLCTIENDGRFHQLNPAWEDSLGWTRDELMACSYLEFVHPVDRDATRINVNEVAAGAMRPAFENRIRRKDGNFRWVSWTASLIRGEELVYAVGRDISERKLAEEALCRSQERFELAVRGSGDGLWDWDCETGESYYSPRWKSMIGYEDHEILHDISEWETRLHPDDRERAVAALRSCTEGGETAYEVEYRFRHKDGSYRWILDRGVAVRNAMGVTRMAGSHTDITERKRMEQELRESELRHQAALAKIVSELAKAQTNFDN